MFLLLQTECWTHCRSPGGGVRPHSAPCTWAERGGVKSQCGDVYFQLDTCVFTVGVCIEQHFGTLFRRTLMKISVFITQSSKTCGTFKLEQASMKRPGGGVRLHLSSFLLGGVKMKCGGVCFRLDMCVFLCVALLRLLLCLWIRMRFIGGAGSDPAPPPD